MCGIAGLIDGTLDRDELRARLAAMQARLLHRGPDGDGQHIDPAAGAGFAHTRLAILDLSPAGAQPLHSPDGRYTIVFNGEIYNYRELQTELTRAGATFRSSGDTEVILEAYRAWGESCTSRFVGMFAFAIWDRLEQTCFLARGPMGIKPLYIWRHNGSFAFASELRALLSADLGPRRLSTRAMRDYLMYGSVQEPLTLVEGIEMLAPGDSLLWRDESSTVRSFARVAFDDVGMDRPTAIATTSQALEASVRRHFVSDVPVSIFLSGGIDSTAILALARRCGFENLRTFSISFDEHEFNEGDVAARTAKHFGAEHHDWRMTADDGAKLLDSFLDAVDQPSNDGFNTFCVSKFAHDCGAKVVLSGLGGDELFGGYQSFREVPKLLGWHRRLAKFERVQQWTGSVVAKASKQNRWRRAGVFMKSAGGVAAAYWAMRGIFSPEEADELTAHYIGANQVGFGGEPWGEPPPRFSGETDQVSYLEMTRYMKNQLLRDSDVMSMAWGLELRVPFVDSLLVDTVGRIPAPIRFAPGKQLILDAVPEIPPWVAEGRKRGFSFPFEQWVAGRWSGVFERLDQQSPVKLRTWYQRWVLLTLEHSLKTYGLDVLAAA